MNVNKKDLVEILERVFEEGYYGYLDLKESVVQAVVAELKEKEVTHAPEMTLAPEQLEFDLVIDTDSTIITSTGTNESLVVNGGYSYVTMGDTVAVDTGSISNATFANTANTFANVENTFRNSFIDTTGSGSFSTGASGQVLTNQMDGISFRPE